MVCKDITCLNAASRKDGGYCDEHQRERAEAAEARAAQLEIDNDEMQSYINEIRVALHTEKDELTIDAVQRIISERDELRAKLDQAQQTCERMNEIIKKIAKEREDIKEERDNLRLSIVNNVSA